MAWADIAAVKTVTGRDVDEVDLALAQASIELHVGRFADDPVGARDARWLRQAVAFQAAWLPDQPDYLERRDTTSEGADGQTVAHRNADSVTLAPLARKALRRLSFRGNRSVALEQRGPSSDDDVADDRLGWQPL